MLHALAADTDRSKGGQLVIAKGCYSALESDPPKPLTSRQLAKRRNQPFQKLSVANGSTP